MVTLQDLKTWAQLNQTFLDVRSPGEFQQGHLPGAINVPILNDDERARVGLTYKTHGREAALVLGHQLVSGENRSQKMNQWISLAKANSNLVLTCFRGGLRSQITQKWLNDEGLKLPLVNGGYKACRQLLSDYVAEYCQQNHFLVVSGATGSAKTRFLNQVHEFWPALDLEAHAEHRGSAFGKLGVVQPEQAVFENRISWALLQESDRARDLNVPILLEDESRLIGKRAQPEFLFQALRRSPIVWLDVPVDHRVENTMLDYLELPLANATTDVQARALFARYRTALFDIQSRLGGVRYQEILKLLDEGERSWFEDRNLGPNRLWIHRLLVEYYDPMYFSSLEKRNPTVYFKGTPEAAFDFLKGANSINKAIPVSTKATKI